MQTKTVDVLCVGAGTYDLVYSVDHHPNPDEKIRADSFLGCGGGPAANGAVTVSRFGLNSAFVGYLGYDIFGQAHYEELLQAGVLTKHVVRGNYSSALSVVIVKPDGSRALVNYRKTESFLQPEMVDLSDISTKVILFDGHEPQISPSLAKAARKKNIVTVLDAGSIHRGTEELAGLVDYLVCSEKFGLEFSGEKNELQALEKLGPYAETVVITLGPKGLVWKNAEGSGSLPAYKVRAVDSTGAGDVFHGVLAACLSENKNWAESLRYASAAGALCCTKTGARPGIPTRQEIKEFLVSQT